MHQLATRLSVHLPQDLIHANRLRYFARAHAHGPIELIAVAQPPAAFWTQHMRETHQWALQHLGATT
eukprot:4797227-Lingulodinium_polyedra.AAC.1